MGLLDRILGKKETDPDAWRRELLQNGRITEGVILEASSRDEVVHYLYTLNGVDFESSHVLTREQLAEPVKYAPGATVNVRYDSRNQGNSTIE